MADEQSAGEASARVFFALWPTPTLQRALHGCAVALKPACGGRVMRRETLHLTLAFIGDVPRARLPELVEAGSEGRLAPFGMQLDQTGYWSHNRIVWLGVSQCPAALLALAGRLGHALAQRGFPLEKRRFHPHVTLLRKARQQPVPAGMLPLHWQAEDFVLVESVRDHEGARYRELARWPLGGEVACV